MSECSQCGRAISVWKRDLFSGKCPDCRRFVGQGITRGQAADETWRTSGGGGTHAKSGVQRGGSVKDKLRLDEQGRIGVDLTCLKCGYNLHGLAPKGTCPECGTPIKLSVRGNLLRFAEPDWVEMLAVGMNWIVTSIWAGIALAVIAIAARVLAGATLQGGLELLGLIPGVIGVVGYWKVTTPELGRSGDENVMSARSLARLGDVGSFVFTTAQKVMALGSLPAATILEFFGGIVSLVGFFATFLYARSLALRIPNESLANQTRTVMWGYCLTVAASILLLLLVLVAGARGAAGIVGCPLGVGFLVFSIWALVLIFRYRRAMLEAAQLARDSWARDAVEGVGG